MPIVRVPYPQPLPVNTDDYEAQNNLIEAGFWRVNEPNAVLAGNIVMGSVFQCGGTIYYANAATAIGGVASNYVKLTPNGDGSQLIPTYVANLGGVAWNSAYNGYYDGLGNLYIFNEALAMIVGKIAVVEQRYAQQERTGDLPVGRDLKPGRNIDFTESGVDGDHAINFASDAAHSWDEANDTFKYNKKLRFTLTPVYSTQAIAAGADYTIPAGIWHILIVGNSQFQIHDNAGGTWRNMSIGSTDATIFVISDGSNYRVHANANDTIYLFQIA